MSFRDEVIDRTRRIERLLGVLGAQGRGIHDRVTILASVLPPSLANRLRFIASVRNKLMHVDGYVFDDGETVFLDKCDLSIRELDGIVDARNRPPTEDGSSVETHKKRPGKMGSKSSRWPAGRVVVATLVCLLGCLWILPGKLTYTQVVESKPGKTAGRLQPRQVPDWNLVLFTTVGCCVFVFLLTRRSR